METKDIIKSLRVCNTGKSCRGCFLKDNKLAGCRVRLMDYAADRLERLQRDLEEERNRRRGQGNV
jgi:hypothetical protein